MGYGYALERNDIAAPYFRDMGVFLIRGISAKRIMAQYFGKKTGVTGGKEGNVHIGDLNFGVFAFPSHLADNYPVGTGAALAFKIRGEKRIAVACTGDGGTSRGDFHEGMNFAAARKLPMVFICNNNQYAYSTPLRLQMNIKDIAERPWLTAYQARLWMVTMSLKCIRLQKRRMRLQEMVAAPHL